MVASARAQRVSALDPVWARRQQQSGWPAHLAGRAAKGKGVAVTTVGVQKQHQKGPIPAHARLLASVGTLAVVLGPTTTLNPTAPTPLWPPSEGFTWWTFYTHEPSSTQQFQLTRSSPLSTMTACCDGSPLCDPTRSIFMTTSSPDSTA